MTLRSFAVMSALTATLLAAWRVSTPDGPADSASIARPTPRHSISATGGLRPMSGMQQKGTRDARMNTLSANRVQWPGSARSAARIVSFAPPIRTGPAAKVIPTAPPLPFKYVGAIEDEQGKAVFLLDGSVVRMVRPGEQLGSEYRVEAMTSEGLQITYLPLGQKQTLGR